MKRLVAIAVLWAATSAAARTVQLKPTPVRDALDASIREYALAGEFDRVNDASAGTQPSGEPASPAGRSVFKAGLLSALVPGAGEYYLGNRGKARFFFAAEALTWLGYISFRTYGNWKRDDYIRYASVHANAQLEGREDDFLDLVGFYDDIDQYNSLARVLDPTRPYLEDTPENHWRWHTLEDRFAFRHLKNRSRDAYLRANFMIGVAIVDRLISVVDAVRDARRMQRRLDGSFSRHDDRRVRIAVNPLAARNQVTLTILTGF
ncbi:MAG TPA: hypothetical protein VMY05_09075 [Acidobacteriota bacterium]|nr:hypothetical protein [Acidobacteriota bacterium]